MNYLGTVWRHKRDDYVFVVVNRSKSRSGYDSGYLWTCHLLDGDKYAFSRVWWESSFEKFAERIT